MSKQTLILFLAVISVFVSCRQREETGSRDVIVEHAIFEEEIDDVEPPPPNLVPSQKTIHEWLSGIANSDAPNKAIGNYNFGVFESPGEYVIYLVGINKYTEKNKSSTRIEFEPPNMYFILPPEEYKNLSRKQVLNKILLQLKSFTETTQFKTSFLAKARSITTDFGGEIWSR